MCCCCCKCKKDDGKIPFQDIPNGSFYKGIDAGLVLFKASHSVSYIIAPGVTKFPYGKKLEYNYTKNIRYEVIPNPFN